MQASPVWQKVACPARKSKRQLNAGWRRLRERSARRNEQLNTRGGIEGPDVSSTRGCGGAYESAPRAVASSSTRGVDPLTRTRSARAAARAAQRVGWDRLRFRISRARALLARHTNMGTLPLSRQPHRDMLDAQAQPGARARPAARPPARQACRTPCSSHPALTAGRCASRSCISHGVPG